MAQELKDPAYWIGHLFTVVATIVGVYLAATVGFKKALDLEIIRADRGTYYLAASLHSELGANIENIQKYINNVGDNPHPFKEHFTGIAINTFILDAAKFNDGALEIEPNILQDVSIYYFEVSNAIKTYHATNQSSPATLYKKLKASQKRIQDNKALQRLADYTAALKANVESRGVDLSQPSY